MSGNSGPIGPTGPSGEPNTGQPFEGVNLVRSGFGVVGTTTGGGGTTGSFSAADGTELIFNSSNVLGMTTTGTVFNETVEIEALKARVAELELVKVGQMSRLEVGPNDILIVNLDVTNVPRNRVDAYMVRAKKSLVPLFEERGLRGRVLWVPTRERETGFSVIGVNDREQHLAQASSQSATVGTLTLTRRARKKYPPPVMG